MYSMFFSSQDWQEGTILSSNTHECLHLLVNVPFKVVQVLEHLSGRSLLIISKKTIVRYTRFYSPPQYLCVGY